MSNQDYSRGNASSGDRRESPAGRQEGSKQSGAISSVTAEVSAKARQLTTEAAETVTQQTRHLLDNQLSAGADVIGALAGATRRAAEDLKQQSPQIAKFVDTVADRVDAYSDQLRGQSVQDLLRSANAFTRQQPALVFGLAALAGFFACRVVKATPTGPSMMSSPSIQPGSENRSRHAHGPRTH